MQKLVHSLVRIAAAIASVCLLALMLITFVDVIGRYVFDHALPFAVEIIQLAMGLLVFFGLALTTFERGHISVDIISTFVRPSTGRLLVLLASVATTVFFALATWQLWVRAVTFKSDGLTTEVLLLPVYPVAFAMCIASGFVAVICFYQMLTPQVVASDPLAEFSEGVK